MDITLYGKELLNIEEQRKIIKIPRGQHFEETIRLLSDLSIINNPLKFKMLAGIKGYTGKIKAGEYLVTPQMTVLIILENMVYGRVFLHKLTIPEGYTLVQIAVLIEEGGWGSRVEFLSIAKNPKFVKQCGFDGETLEGYLFPDTYYFSGDTPINKIILTLINRFKKAFSSKLEERTKKLGFSVNQAITLASIIEKETGVPDERPLVSSVFHNRLQRKMRLESDPTVIYGLEDFDGDIKSKDLNTPTPYNTYKRSGLPPGPIANPGIESINAALYPARTDFLFFVSKKDHTHYFSKNFDEHRQAVEKYQLSGSKK
jgi:UPF0755 protein